MNEQIEQVNRKGFLGGKTTTFDLRKKLSQSKLFYFFLLRKAVILRSWLFCLSSLKIFFIENCRNFLKRKRNKLVSSKMLIELEKSFESFANTTFVELDYNNSIFCSI